MNITSEVATMYCVSIMSEERIFLGTMGSNNRRCNIDKNKTVKNVQEN